MPRFDKDRLPELTQDFEKGASVDQLRDEYSLGNRGILRNLMEAGKQGLISKEKLARLLVEKTQADFPEDPEARLEAVLSCMNSELKQATLLMLDRHPRTGGSIRSRLKRLTNAALPHWNTLRSYCTQTLSPIGFLVEERFGQDLGLADRYFTLSDAGEEYGQPIAAFSLRYAVENNTSLYELLGPTNSPGDSRAPYNRARIIELVGEGYKRIVDIKRELGLDSALIHRHLKHQQKLGLLTVDSFNPEQSGIKIYTWVEGRRPEEAIPHRYKTLTRAVAHWLYKNKRGNYKCIAHELGYKSPPNVSSILTNLAEQGLATRRFASNDKSKIVPRKKSALLGDYTKTIRNALKGESALKDMKAILKVLLMNDELLGEYLDAGIKFYNEVSPWLNTTGVEGRETEVLDFIKGYQEEHRKGPRPVEIEERLGWNHGTTHTYLTSLLDEGYLKREKSGKAMRYSIVA